MSLIALAASVVLAQAAAPPAATLPAKATEVAPITVTGKEKDPLVCKVSQPLGSKVPKRTCQRKSDMEQAQVQAREDVEYMQRTTEPFFRPKEP
jgi:hypothetical protein